MDVNADAIRTMTTDMLATMRGHHVAAVVIDLSHVHTLDTSRFTALRECVKAMVIAGVPATLLGMQPGVAWSLAELDVDLKGLLFAPSLDVVTERLPGGNSA
jgi:anti-anti-sigma regulatory factor